MVAWIKNTFSALFAFKKQDFWQKMNIQKVPNEGRHLSKMNNIFDPMMCTMVIWVVEFSSTKLERFLPKNQHTQRKLLNFENWCKMGRCGRQNMLGPYLKIWEREFIFGRTVKAISSPGVRSLRFNRLPNNIKETQDINSFKTLTKDWIWKEIKSY